MLEKNLKFAWNYIRSIWLASTSKKKKLKQNKRIKKHWNEVKHQNYHCKNQYIVTKWNNSGIVLSLLISASIKTYVCVKWLKFECLLIIARPPLELPYFQVNRPWALAREDTVYSGICKKMLYYCTFPVFTQHK